jgi:hypothetical protein
MTEKAPSMEEGDLVGIQHPDTGLGFISVMGLLGEHYAVSVYRGAKGLYDFWKMQEHAMESEGPPLEAFLEMSHVQLSFEDRDMLTDEDRSLIKKLGLKYRGRQEWPMFRSDGQFPWYLDAQEALFLTVGLEQLLDTDAEQIYFVRVAEKTPDGGIVWREEKQHIPKPKLISFKTTLDSERLERLKKLPVRRGRFEMDVFLLPNAVRENKGERTRIS